MTLRTNTYEKESLPNEYAHSFHAGNVGDVWKHIVLLSVLADLSRTPAPLRLIDCYAGAGGYPLSATGEWTEGIGALLRAKVAEGSSAIQRYREAVEPRFSSQRFYCGSPLLIESLLRENDLFVCHETNVEACRQLTKNVAARTEVFGSDGLEGLRAMVTKARASNSTLFALLDPPWVKKEDWQSIPRALVEAWKCNPQAILLLWYPIKSYTRVNVMLKGFKDAGLPIVSMDLITTPLEHKRNRLNGSGLVLVNGSPEVVSEVSQAASWVGRACATHKHYWSFQVREL